MVPTETPASKLDDPAIRTRRFKSGHAIDWITDDGIAGAPALDNDDILFLLTDNDADLARILHGIQKDLIAEDIEFLLVIASGIGCTGQPEEVDQRRSADVVGNELARQLQPNTQTR